VVGHPKPDESDKTRKRPLGLDGVQRGHGDVYWFGRNVPTFSGELLVLLALKFVVGVTNGRERDELPNLCGLSVYVLFSHPPS
jgi:hypothetical protein